MTSGPSVCTSRRLVDGCRWNARSRRAAGVVSDMCLTVERFRSEGALLAPCASAVKRLRRSPVDECVDEPAKDVDERGRALCLPRIRWQLVHVARLRDLELQCVNALRGPAVVARHVPAFEPPVDDVRETRRVADEAVRDPLNRRCAT